MRRYRALPNAGRRYVSGRGLSFEGEESWGHRVTISGDRDQVGAKASDLLPLSLAACLSCDIVVVLRKKRQDLRTLQVVVASEQEEVSPQRFVRIALRFEVGGDVDPAAARGALEIAEKHCPVLASIASAVRVDTSIEVCQCLLSLRSRVGALESEGRSCLWFAASSPSVDATFT